VNQESGRIGNRIHAVFELPGSVRSNIFQSKRDMKALYTFILITSITTAVLIYGVLFNRVSETAMIRWSYLWFPGLLFGAVGLKTSPTSPNRPIVIALMAVVGLFLFFELILPAL
jgi:hypothetical protein